MKSLQFRLFALIISVTTFCIVSVSAQSSHALDSMSLLAHKTFEIENQQMRIKFHPESGTYDVWGKTNPKKNSEPILSDMLFSLNDFSSTDAGYKHQGMGGQFDNHFGNGQQLQITSTSTTGQPTLYLTLRIYDNQSFITARGGMKNTTTEPIQLKTITPAEGKIFTQIKKFPHLSILEGNGGANLTRVLHAAPVKSKNNILMTFGTEHHTRSLIMGGLTYVDYQKSATIDRPVENGPFQAMVQMYDDVGKRIDPDKTYTPEDLVYIDFLTNNPFEAAEQYARTMRDAMRVNINAYTFPSICMWFISVRHFGGDIHSVNDTPGAVREMDHIVKSGFLKYSPVAVRMVPDNYEANNEQGWWDDKHWQMYGRKERCVVEGGHYKAPYETTAKWCKAITDRGGIPTTYFQPGVRSEDYAEAFPEHMLFNEAHRYRLNSKGESYVERHGIRGGIYNIKMQESYDYTDPGFLKHMRKVYANLAKGGMRGVFYDYPTRAYPGRGGMEDKYSTAAAAYRTVYQLARESLGPVCYLQERLAWGSDLATGLVDSQRTEGDTNVLNPRIVRRAGLRWYKNRMITNYDMDGKALIAKGPTQEIPISETERRAILTMNYTISARLLLTETFSKMSPQVLHDLSRTIPYHDTTLTARPLNAFISDDPAIFDFAISPQWHQLVLYNSDNLSDKTFEVRLAGDTAFGAIGLDADHDYYLYDFWNDRFCGKVSGSDSIKQTLSAGEARMLSIHAVENHPQWISTDRHLMQGYVDLVKKPQWNAAENTLSGTSSVIGGEPSRITLVLNGYNPKKVTANGATADITIRADNKNLADLVLKVKENQDVVWTIAFSKEANYDEAKIPKYTLPDPLTMADGTKVVSPEQWRLKRRGEILDLFKKHVYGAMPPAISIAHVERDSFIDNALSGKARLLQETLYLRKDRSGPKFNVCVFLPPESGKAKAYPAFLALNFFGNHTIHADPNIRMHTGYAWRKYDRGGRASKWEIEKIVAKGYALVTVCYSDFDPDDRINGVRFDDGVHQLYPQYQGRSDNWASIGAWAWGMSRVLDYLENLEFVDARRVVAMGHSRLGKTALWAGANDQRFALVISNNSGCGGAALARRRIGESVWRINTSFPHWFCAKHKEYNDNENAMPVDQHMLISLIAPRPVYVASAIEDRWADPRGEFLSCVGADGVYKLLNISGLESHEWPKVERPVVGRIGYHVRNGKHDVTEYDWAQYLDFADKYMK